MYSLMSFDKCCVTTPASPSLQDIPRVPGGGSHCSGFCHALDFASINGLMRCALFRAGFFHCPGMSLRFTHVVSSGLFLWSLGGYAGFCSPGNWNLEYGNSGGEARRCPCMSVPQGEAAGLSHAPWARLTHLSFHLGAPSHLPRTLFFYHTLAGAISAVCHEKSYSVHVVTSFFCLSAFQGTCSPQREVQVLWGIVGPPPPSPVPHSTPQPPRHAWTPTLLPASPPPLHTHLPLL